jgi:chromosome segregation ATPase
LSEEFYKLKAEMKEVEPLKRKVFELESALNQCNSDMEKMKTLIKTLEHKLESLNHEKEGLSSKRDLNFENKNDMKKHLKEHDEKIQCNVCELAFDIHIDFEVHLKTHEKAKTFKCDICNQEFYLNWRLRKHKEGHEKSLKYCHYFNNDLICPYEDNGCKFAHKVSPVCRFNLKCTNKLCPFRHTNKETHYTEKEEDEQVNCQKSK